MSDAFEGVDKTKGGGGKTIRGSTELVLTTEGKEEIRALNREIIKRGCFWRIYYSTQMRAAETAHILTQNCPSTSFMRPSPELESWHLGSYEGRLVVDVLKDIQDLVARRPWVVPVGMGPKSTKPGESFNTFKNRVLSKVRELMTLSEEHPTKRIGVVTHFHDIQLLDAWLAEYQGKPGPEDDFYNPTIYNQEKGYPGEVIWVHKARDGAWKFTRFDITKYAVLPPGLYFIRHGSTAAN